MLEGAPGEQSWLWAQPHVLQHRALGTSLEFWLAGLRGTPAKDLTGARIPCPWQCSEQAVMPGLCKTFISAVSAAAAPEGGTGSIRGKFSLDFQLCWWWSFLPCLRRENSTCRVLLTPFAGKSATNLPALGLLDLINSAAA